MTIPELSVSMHDKDDEHEILQLFIDGDRGLIAADLAVLSRVFADDYIQYDESGKAYTKEDVLNNLKSGAIRYVSMTSTGRHIRRLTENVALVQGSEDDEVEQAGRRFQVRYIYTDVVVKRDRKWQIVASQLARPEGSRDNGRGNADVVTDH